MFFKRYWSLTMPGFSWHAQDVFETNALERRLLQRGRRGRRRHRYEHPIPAWAWLGKGRLGKSLRRVSWDLIASVISLFQTARQNANQLTRRVGTLLRPARRSSSHCGLPNEALLHFLSHPEVRGISFWNRYEHASLGITASVSVANLDRKRSESA
jgi:hypothetical protein